MGCIDSKASVQREVACVPGTAWDAVRRMTVSGVRRFTICIKPSQTMTMVVESRGMTYTHNLYFPCAVNQLLIHRGEEMRSWVLLLFAPWTW